MNESRYVLEQYPKDHKGKFIAFGQWDDMTDALSLAGWEGVIADHMAFERISGVYDKIQHIHGPVMMSSHYIPVGQQYLMRAITFREILDNFAGPFDLVTISIPGLGKDLATCDEMWVAWPKAIAVKSEGREQEIANLCNKHAYKTVRIERDSMILARPEFVR